MNIIPKPNEIINYDGNTILSASTVVEGDFPISIKYIKEFLSALNNKEEGVIRFVKDPNLVDEGYILDIEDIITIKAKTENGAFYACQTILQLLNGSVVIPKCLINDKPKYKYRGFMLDVARHFWTVDKIKEILDVMANIKMNLFHWHLSEDQGWRAEIKKYPLLTEKGAIRSSTAISQRGCFRKRDNNEYGRGLFYSVEQMKEIVSYAKDRHIDVIPEIDMPGHLVSAIACYPELSCRGEKVEVSNRWGVKHNIACCGKENIYNFAKDIIDELAEVFPSKYFHIGGDEVPKSRWKRCPKCQAKIKELGLKNENELQGYFNNEIAKYLRSKGKTTVGWNEILDASILEKDIIAEWWTKHKDNNNEINWLEKGGKLVLSYADYVYMDHPYSVRPLSKTYSFNAASLGIKNDANVLGIEAPQWTEYVSSIEKFDLNTYARLITISEISWTKEENKDYINFENRLEYLRKHFESYGGKLAPKEIYQGHSIDSSYSRGWRLWRKTPNYEVEASRKLGGNQ